MKKPNILLTNDDGIRSPGLWAAAEALSRLGFVTVAAPREQSSSVGRSQPANSDGIISEETIVVHGQSWKVYAIGGTPAQAVQHSLLEILDEKPDLVVSGINYGANIATGITISGTVGAAMESASLGIPSLAMSLDTPISHHLSYSREIDFSASAHFTYVFAKRLLEQRLPAGVDLIKVDVPDNATPETPWEWTILSHQRYYVPSKPKRSSWDIPESVGYEIEFDEANEPHNSDTFTITRKKHVSVTPLTLDMTATTANNFLLDFANPNQS